MTSQLLPTTMVGSYPRPGWFRYQLEGRDILEAFKVIHHAEAFEDAVRTVLKDQEEAGLDLLTDGVEGCVFPVGDVSALTEALRRVLASPETASAMGRRGLETISKWGYEEDMIGLRRAITAVTRRLPT